MFKILQYFRTTNFYCFKLIITLGYKFCLHVFYVKRED